MDLRNKWISQHPEPPQDKETFAMLSQQPSNGNFFGSPRSVGGRKTPMESGQQKEFRRRSVAPYEVFDVPLPPSDTALEFRLVRGVMCVRARRSPAMPTMGSVVSTVTSTTSASMEGENDDEIAEEESEEEESLWTESLFPVLSYQDFYQDFTQVGSGCFTRPVVIS
jgi:hypothetical protein